MTENLTKQEQQILLEVARQAIEKKVRGQELPTIDLETLPPLLREQGASFVTLTKKGSLRGCIGTLEASQPLVNDVQLRAVAAALDDFRFPTVTPDELPEIKVEVSRLTSPQPLEYETPEELLEKLRPGIDGVVLRDGMRRATFLPQVWEQLPEPEQFLSRLCYKMGASMNAWREKKLDVSIYHVEKFKEEEASECTNSE
ncbi:MAG: AmmeMemoRadiSam system protein A [Chloroflexota bacterium]|nr:AmmeMemoRadiSam system protein A [Chloroflexota bacterium]